MSDLFYNVASRQGLQGSRRDRVLLAQRGGECYYHQYQLRNSMLSTIVCLKGSASSTTTPYVAAKQEHVRCGDPAAMLANDDTQQSIEYLANQVAGRVVRKKPSGK
jgi:hypothetical protein